jgi:hypothetical protein
MALFHYQVNDRYNFNMAGNSIPILTYRRTVVLETDFLTFFLLVNANAAANNNVPFENLFYWKVS